MTKRAIITISLVPEAETTDNKETKKEEDWEEEEETDADWEEEEE